MAACRALQEKSVAHEKKGTEKEKVGLKGWLNVWLNQLLFAASITHFADRVLARAPHSKGLYMLKYHCSEF